MSEWDVQVPEQFHLSLRRLRTQIGMTQQQLADFSTLSVRAIRNLEQGRVRRPRRETVKLLADALRLRQDDRSLLELLARRAGVVNSLAGPPGEDDPDGELEALAKLLEQARRRQLFAAGTETGAEPVETVIAAVRGSGADSDWRLLWVVSS